MGTYIPNRIAHLNAEVTRSCNLKCDYCFNASGKRMPNELDASGWKRVIDVSKNRGAKSSLFTGGEVMTREDAPGIIGYSVGSGLETSILTNGYRLRELGKDLTGSLGRVQVSLDSASPVAHDLRRGEGSWKVAREAIDYARSQGTPVEISATVSQDRLSELEGMAGIVYATGSKLLVRPMLGIGRASRKDKGDIKQTLDEIKRYLTGVFGEIFVEDFAHYVPILGNSHDNQLMPKGFITVLPDGVIRGTSLNILQLSQAA